MVYAMTVDSKTLEEKVWSLVKGTPVLSGMVLRIL